MDLESARKSLSKRSAFSTKKIAFVVAAGIVLVVGIGLRASHFFGETPAASEPATLVTPSPEPAAPPPAEMAPPGVETPPSPRVTQPAAPAPIEPAQQSVDTAAQPEPEGDAAGQAGHQDLPGSGMILVSRKPVEVLAGPSATAPAMFGFPAGRPFRVIGREGDFVHIQDLRSSASGWIDAAALAAPPPSAPTAKAPSQAKPPASGKAATASADPKPKPAKKSAPAVADSEPAPALDSGPARRPPTLFGRGGFFGGIFSD